MGEELPFQAAPERNPTRYSPRAHANREKCSQLATEFFKNGVARARERHLRQERLNQQLANAEGSSQKQSQLWAAAAAAASGGDGGDPSSVIADAPEMTLPFIGYTFKRFEDHLGGIATLGFRISAGAFTPPLNGLLAHPLQHTVKMP
ncbi:hypothetical protein MAPG_08977 [Magnaporthiopsis poae ATCC 64411]|uniref:Uncharacterized protein n=1 Tax=Magnaporthiopsis poae (strain ATCC 64411 / 73-15) TaxID=644358 RepID=A0A0C4E8R1_MAGP6|nr:hypothetical protein MAPG_08977 [Magnaporthiopsis poae ATCC 64411]